MKKFFVAIDGDDVGHHLEYLMLTNDTDALAQFSANHKQTMDWFAHTLVETFNASVVFSGGDNLLVSIDGEMPPVERFEAMRALVANRTGCTLSVGIGQSARQAYIALKLAKTSGKNCIRWFKELDDG